MKKTLRDLRIGDPIYYLKGPEIAQTSIASMSESEIGMHNRYTIPIEKGDWKRWKATGIPNYGNYPQDFYTEKIDVLILSRSAYEIEIQNEHDKIRKTLDHVEQFRMDQVRVEEEINKELLNKVP